MAFKEEGSQVTGFVYYCDDGRGRVKIGYSRDPVKRLREFKTVNPEIELVFRERSEVFDGRELEQKRHDQFSQDHIAGEWFYRSQRLDEWIRFHTAIRRVEWSIKNQWAAASVFPKDAGCTFNLYDENGELAGDIDNPPKEWTRK